MSEPIPFALQERECVQCKKTNLLVTHFQMGRSKKCKDCLRKTVKAKEIPNGTTDKKNWGYYNMGFMGRRDPRDTCLIVE